MKRALLTLFGVLSISAFVAVALPHNAHAQAMNNSTQTDQTITKTNNPTTEQANTGVYKYTAQAGDSYSVLARKAIQTYGLETKTDLSGAQIVFAETNVTLEAQSPRLVLGQELSVSKDTVKAWVEKAKQLTPAQVSAWNYYVQFVDFNTNNNGQA